MEAYYNTMASGCGYQRSNGNSNCRPFDMQRPVPKTCGMPKADCNTVNNMMHQKPSYNHQEKSIDIECVCKVNTEKVCHMDDPMEQLGYKFPVAMVYIPWQQWGETFEPDCALMEGTFFKELDKIFCGVRC